MVAGRDAKAEWQGGMPVSDKAENDETQESLSTDGGSPCEDEGPKDTEAPDQEEVNQLKEKLVEIQEENKELLDKYRRSAAEFANYRKRQDRDRATTSRRLRMEVLIRLLPIIDDFRLAMDNAPEADEWVSGVQLVERKLQTLLSEFGATPMEALGKPFDPNYHEALMPEHSDEYEPGVVSSVIRQGYMMGDEVLRPAMVGVSQGPNATES